MRSWAVWATLLLTGAAVAYPAHASKGQPLSPDQSAYRNFIKKFRTVALRQGIPGSLYDRAFHGLSPDAEVIEKNNRQPEFVLPPSHYMALAVTDTRIRGGRHQLSKHAVALDRIEHRYGVDRHILVAIWGMETLYGTLRGKRNVIRSLSTLSYKGRRTKFGRTQLLEALKIIKSGDIALNQMTGSWAGAMGHTQFIPTSYTAYAVDFTGDGRRDIWGSPQDALASTANYLAQNGWVPRRPWGHEVTLPEDFDAALTGRKHEKPIGQWRRLGVRHSRGRSGWHPEARANLFLPAGRQGPAFLLRRNFRSIMRYNPTHKYALAVGHLAQRLSGEGRGLSWPDGVAPIPEADRKELQQLLAIQGYDVGAADGIIGPKTRAAVRKYQRNEQLPVDGFPRPELIERLKAKVPAKP